jgi:hypothetical protein
VKLDKLARQLRRDISASPKKAAALGLMLVVALYFWAPMVWGWMKPGGSKTVAAADSGVILEDDPVDPAAVASRARHDFAWEKIRKQLAADPHMTPALFDPGWRDPFRRAANQLPAGPGIAASGLTQQPKESQLDPAAAGLAVTSVVIGSRRKSATIAGDTYAEGDLITPVDANGQPVERAAFRLAKVGYHGVELERNGTIYTLELQRAKLAQGDEITSQRHD